MIRIQASIEDQALPEGLFAPDNRPKWLWVSTSKISYPCEHRSFTHEQLDKKRTSDREYYYSHKGQKSITKEAKE